MTAVLARHAIHRRVGMRMFQAVIIFGLATVVFALSHLIWLSLLALVIMGAADMVSVVIRVSLVQLGTPDEMRGRVGAVNLPVRQRLQPAWANSRAASPRPCSARCRRPCWAEWEPSPWRSCG